MPNTQSPDFYDVNALLTDNGFVLPKYVVADPARVWKPGFLGNVIIGAAAAFVTWGLYGRWAGAVIAGAPPGSTSAKFYETLSGFTGAFLAGSGALASSPPKSTSSFSG